MHELWSTGTRTRVTVRVQGLGQGLNDGIHYIKYLKMRVILTLVVLLVRGKLINTSLTRFEGIAL